MENNELIEKKVKKSSKKENIKKYIIPIVIVVLIVLIDQISKIVCLNLGEINVIDNVFKIGIHENISPAYGIGNDSTAMYVITNLVIILVLAKFITSQNEFITRKMKVFLSLIIAGGISNVIDRIARGSVLEIFNFGQANLPSFNVADLSILIGWIGCVAIFAAFTVRELRKNKQDKEIEKSILEDKDKKENKKEQNHQNKEK